MDSADLVNEIEALQARIHTLTADIGAHGGSRATGHRGRMGGSVTGEATLAGGTPGEFGRAYTPTRGSSSRASPDLVKPIVTPESYNGQGSYRDWFTHFDTCRNINRWTDQQACQFLAVKLKGSALRVFSDLSPYERQDYDTVTTALKERFDPDRDTGVFWAQLRGRTRKKGESLADLAGHIQRLTCRAYPEVDSSARGTIEIQHFIDALDNKEIQKQLRRNKPSTLGEAVRMALDEESFDKLEGVAKTANNPVGSLTENNSAPESESELCKLEKRVADLEQLLRKHCMVKPQGNSPVPVPHPYTVHGRVPRGPQCFRCSGWGHVQRDCPLN